MRNKKRVIFTVPTPPVLTEKIKAAQMNKFVKNPKIPVLTDILQSPEKKPAPASIKPATSVAAALDTLPWDELEERLTGRIRKQVIERLNFVLDNNISQHVSSILEQMAMMLAEEIKHDMHKTLEVIVTNTISAELQRLKKGSHSRKYPFSPEI
ncbi:MAG: hypothetical protein FWG01_00265 [Betaproteobacteria bacterium]|nr:hypothetical protein [Betaproteobacteria bacterium]